MGSGEPEYYWKQNRELDMKLQIGLQFKFGFVTIFHFPVPRALAPHPVPCS